MALTRKSLQAMGLSAEQVDSIVEMHTEVTDGLKADRDTYKEKADKFDSVQKELNAAKEQLAKYSENGETVNKEDYDKLKAEYDSYKADITAKETRTAKANALSEMLKGIGIPEKRLATVAKTYNLDEIELDKDGKIKDFDKKSEAAKTEWADFIETQSVKGANTANPPANKGTGGTKTKEEILAIKDGATRRQEMMNNPSLFPELQK